MRYDCVDWTNQCPECWGGGVRAVYHHIPINGFLCFRCDGKGYINEVTKQ